MFHLLRSLTRRRQSLNQHKERLEFALSGKGKENVHLLQGGDVSECYNVVFSLDSFITTLKKCPVHFYQMNYHNKLITKKSVQREHSWLLLAA